jgi:hypothetical protein
MNSFFMEVPKQSTENNENVIEIKEWRSMQETGPKEAAAFLQKEKLPSTTDEIKAETDPMQLGRLVDTVSNEEMKVIIQMKEARAANNEDMYREANDKRYILRHLGFLRAVANHKLHNPVNDNRVLEKSEAA